MNATEAAIKAARDLDEHPGAWKDHGDAKMAELMTALREALRVYDCLQAAGS